MVCGWGMIGRYMSVDGLLQLHALKESVCAYVLSATLYYELPDFGRFAISCVDKCIAVDVMFLRKY